MALIEDLLTYNRLISQVLGQALCIDDNDEEKALTRLVEFC